MTGNGRNLSLVKAIPAPEDDGTVWVPRLDIPMRDDQRDLIQTDLEDAS